MGLCSSHFQITEKVDQVFLSELIDRLQRHISVQDTTGPLVSSSFTTSGLNTLDLELTE